MPAATSPPSSPRGSGLLPFIVAAAFFMEYLDTTIITTALPQMARSFGVGPNDLSLGMTAYMLTLAVFIPVSGWIADRFGSRTVFGSAIVVFTLASLSCAAATGLVSFTLSRVLQGLGGAMMVPVGRMIVVRNTDRARMIKAISTITWPGVAAPVFGPTLGGFITTFASWHWIFLINLPIGAAVLLATIRYVPQQFADERRALDRVGLVLSGVALTTLLLGTELASHPDVRLLVSLGLILVAGLFGALTLRHFRRVAAPLLDFATFRARSFATTLGWGSLSRMGIESVPYMAPLLFQVGFGLTPFRSGLLLLGSAVGNLGMKLFTTQILTRWGFRPVAVVNTLLTVCFIASCGWLSPGTPLLLTVLLLGGYGVGRSMQLTTLATLAYADIPDAQKGMASTQFSAAQAMTVALGVAIAALLLRLVSALHGHASGHYGLDDFRCCFAATALITLVSVVGYLRLPADAGASIGGGSKRPRTV